MPDFNSLSEPAKLAYMSLKDNPALDTPEAIDGGPYAIQQIGAPELASGLAELAAHSPPLAEQKPGGGWRLTDA